MKVLKTNILVALAVLGLAATFYGTSATLVEVGLSIRAQYGDVALWMFASAVGALVAFVALYADEWSENRD